MSKRKPKNAQITGYISYGKTKRAWNSYIHEKQQTTTNRHRRWSKHWEKPFKHTLTNACYYCKSQIISFWCFQRGRKISHTPQWQILLIHFFLPKNHKCHKTSSICESKPSGKRKLEQLTIPFYVPSKLSFLNISLCFQNRPRNDYTSLISCCSCTLWNTNFIWQKIFSRLKTSRIW